MATMDGVLIRIPSSACILNPTLDVACGKFRNILFEKTIAIYN